MSWLCKYCETANPDEQVTCDVCNSISPYLSIFNYGNLTESKPLEIFWEAEYCDSIRIHFNHAIIDVTGENKAFLDIHEEMAITFELTNKVAKRYYQLKIEKVIVEFKELQHYTIEHESFLISLFSDISFVEYLDEIGYDSTHSNLTQQLVRYNRIGRSDIRIITTTKDENAGIVIINYKFDNSKKIGELIVFVIAELRRQHLATCSVKTIMDEILKKNIDEVRVKIKSTYAGVIKSLRSIGFTEFKLNSVDDGYCLMYFDTKRSKTDCAIYEKKARIAYLAKNYEHAISLYDKAILEKIELNVPDERCNIMLGIAHYANGNKKKANAILKKYKKTKYQKNIDLELNKIKNGTK